jgi:hypothetical protein
LLLLCFDGRLHSMGTRGQFSHLMTWSYLDREADNLFKITPPAFCYPSSTFIIFIVLPWQDDKLFLDLQWRLAAGYRLQRRADSQFPSRVVLGCTVASLTRSSPLCCFSF